MTEPRTNEFDVVVLGGGSGGYSAALRAAQLGLTVALIEKDKVGGTCLHAGCIPTKALLHVAEVAESIRHSEGLGLQARLDGIDSAALISFKNGIVGRLHKGLEGLISAAPGITYVGGTGRLVGARTVEVDGITYTGRNLVLATGSTAQLLPGVPVDGRILTSTEALGLGRIPASVIIIGGSAIGIEFASAWRALGTEVTVVETIPRLVPLEDASLSKQLQHAFRRRKIHVLTGKKVEQVEQREDFAAVLLDDGEKLEAEYVLVAVGRRPMTDDLGLDVAGVDTDRGWVVTDERLRTSAEGVYAVGDVVRGLQLAHRGFAHGVFVAEEIAGLAPEPVIDSSIPRVTYSDPELASVGLTETAARAKYGDDVTSYEYNLAGNGRSQILGTTGIVKLVKEPGGTVVGAHMVGARLGEQIGEVSLIVNLGIRPEDISRFIHAHPTQNEALGEAVLALAGKPLHAHS
ncbi:dihydrolipoyl dehydrogenase [Rhodococcus koreensis]